MTPALIKRVESARGPDREIDRDLWKMFAPEDGWMRHLPDTIHWNDGHPWAPFTGSIDAAVSLCERVLPHHAIELSLHRDRDNEWNWSARLTSPEEPPEGEDPKTWWAMQQHPYAALALVLAVLRAVENK